MNAAPGTAVRAAAPDSRARRALAHLHPLRGLRETWQRWRFDQAVRQLSQQIRVQLREDAQAYTVLAWLPGADKGDIEVALDGNQVRIAARAQVEHAQHVHASQLRRERYSGRRTRLLRLPQAIDSAGARAEYRHGVLELVLPKAGPPPTLVPVR